jgi:S-DNA-T family DNA segregation ATPase FtsK/SpoIIIE
VPESIAVLDEVIRVSEKLGLKAQSLWLEPIPTYITLEELRARHAAQPESFVLAPLVGEYDDPAHQAQRPLRLPITEKGNIIVFGSGGSGTETFLNTMVFSLITEYSPADLHLYLFDLGAELLGAFREAPHVGDVVFGSEEEKVLRLFAMLKKTIEDRKKVVSASGLAVAAYNRQADEPLPSIVVVINGINNFYELFLKLEDELNTLTREANRYGLYFVISGTTATAARSRLRTNFKQNIVLSLNDESEYINALGSIRGIVPPVAYARGLVPLGEIYEFQTAHCCTQDETEAAAIAAKCAELAAACTHRAPAVPVLPAHASLELLAPKPVLGPAIPFGIIESTLAPAVFSFEDKPFSRCLYARQRDGSAFLKALLVLLTERQSYYEPVLVDVAGLLPDDSSSPCRRYSAVDEAMCYFDELYDFRAKPPEKPHFVVLCGIGKLLKDGDSAKVAIARIYLKTLAENEGAVFLLFDNIANVNYTSDEWFTVQFDNKNGLWAGAGMANHSPFSLQYPDSNNIDSKLKGDRGYVVTDGRIAAARLATLTD